MRFLKSIVTIAVLLTAFQLHAQNVSDLIINEVLAVNDGGLKDDYGQECGWIEILNTSYATVDFGGCYLSDDRGNLKKYLIPKGDIKTKLPPRQLALFHTDGTAWKGTFHTNFTLENGSTVYLVSNDGKTIIDSLSIPADLKANRSVSRIPVGNRGKEFGTISGEPTPMSQNWDVNAATKSQVMAEKDPSGIIMTLTASSVVFIALIILYLIYRFIGKAQERRESGKTGGSPKKNGKEMDKEMTPEIAMAIAMALDKESGGETHAAIAAALHLYFNDTVHDQESFVLTIKPTFSAWASRYATLRQLPERK